MYRNIILEILKENYKGEHEAPQKSDGDSVAPMFNVIDVFPDMYTQSALSYYSTGNLRIDTQSISIIKSTHNKPTAKVKIFRALPLLDGMLDIQNKITEYSYLIKYYNKFKFFPVDNSYVNNMRDKSKYLSYDDTTQKIYNHIYDSLQQLNDEYKNTNKKYKINTGDWVTINKEYAIEHGESNLRNKNKLIQKTVLANQLYTDGNSIHEWGYDI